MAAWTAASENVLPVGRKTRALLAVLAVAAPRVVTRARLAEQLWSRRPEDQARASLRQEIHRLAEALGPVKDDVLDIKRDHLALRAEHLWVDVHEVMRATVHEPESLSLMDGELLEGLDGINADFDTWLATERERMRSRALTLAETILRDLHDPVQIIPAAERLLMIDRTHEGAWRAMMRAYAERGERAMAIQVYERCRTALADLLDAAPSGETQKLVAEIRTVNTRNASRRGNFSDPAVDVVAQDYAGTARHDYRPPRAGVRLGVLPLQMIGPSIAEETLARGLAEEITTALARFRGLFVVTNASLARFADPMRDDAAIHSAFGVDFLLDGAVQRVGEMLRVTLRLLDLRAGNQVAWARRFDRPDHDTLALQDEIAAEVAAQLNPEIMLIESRRASASPPGPATAYDLMLRALPLIDRLERGPFLLAGEYLARAIELEPSYAAAHAWYAYWYIFLISQAWTDAPEAMMAQAGLHADRAVTIDPQDAMALTIAGHVMAFLHRRVRQSLPLHDRALSINPNLTMALALSGSAYAYMGDLSEAWRRARRYKQLAPIDPHAFFYDTLFITVPLLRGEYDAAVSRGREVTEMNPSYVDSLKPHLAALGHLGLMQEAARGVARLRALEPGFSVERFLATTPFQMPEHRDRIAQGLRLAGIPERAG
jgi:DNA-binding SARP family transcriptional activator/TolB-like protein